MELRKFVTRCNTRNIKYILKPLGDVHYGTKNCDVDKFLDTIEWIKKTPNCYWVGMGDMIEAINYTDRRFDPSSLPGYLQGSLDNLHYEQINRMGDMLKPIAHKCIGLVTGNHEETIRLKYHTNVTSVLAHKLKTAELGNTCIIRWIMYRSEYARNSIDIFVSHSRGQLNKLKQTGRDFDADIYLSGHVHTKVSESTERLVLTGEKNLNLVAKKRIFATTGTFYKTYELGCRSYAEKAAYPPTPTGTIKITIEPFIFKRVNGVPTDMPVHIHVSE